MITFLVGVLASIVAAIVLRILRFTVSSYVFYPYDDMRAMWVGRADPDDGRERHIEVTQQFWRYLSGYATVSNPNQPSEVRKYRFRGKLVRHDLLLGKFELTNSRYPDIGACIIRIDIGAKTAHAGVVQFGWDLKNFLLSTYTVERR